MGVLARSDREIILFYDSLSELGKKCRAQAESAGVHVKIIDLLNEKVTGTEWAKIAELLGKDVQELINQDHPIFKELYGDDKVELNENGAITILEKHPETLVFPIAIRGNRAIQAKGSSSIAKLIDPDGGNIPQP